MNSFGFSIALSKKLKIIQIPYMIQEERIYNIYSLLCDERIKLHIDDDGDFKFDVPDGHKDLYFGMTKKRCEKRWKEHKHDIDKADSDTKRKLWKRAKEIGFEHFRKIKLMECLTMEEAKAVEIYLIAMYDTYEKGLNSTPGGDTWGYGLQHSEAVKMSWSRDPQRRKKTSIRMSGNNSPVIGKKFPKTPEQIAKTSGENHCFFGKTHSIETRAKISASLVGGKSAMFGKTGALHPNFGKTGALHPKSKPIYVFGKMFSSAKEASDKLRPEYNYSISNDNFVKKWVKQKKRKENVFYVSKHFYDYVIEFDIKNVSFELYKTWSAFYFE